MHQISQKKISTSYFISFWLACLFNVVQFCSSLLSCTCLVIKPYASLIVYFKFTLMIVGVISRIWPALLNRDQDSWFFIRWYFLQWIWSDFWELKTLLQIWQGISWRSWWVTEMWKAKSFLVKYFFGQVGTGHLKFLILACAWKYNDVWDKNKNIFSAASINRLTHLFNVFI